jgi:4-amino-4-deoxy-L-arabinose transferase-like glycosyltransferase
VSKSSPWRDLSSWQVALALALLMAVINGIWLFIDSSAPSWDQSHYLTVALEYQRAFEAGGPIEFLHAVKGADPSHGPLFTVLLLPFIWIFGASARSGLILNLCAAPILFFCAGEIAWTIFRSWFARLLTIVLVGLMPLMIGLFHNVLQDFLLITLAIVSIMFLLKSEGFQRRWMTIFAGLAMGLGTLTKVTFPLFVIGPVVVVVAQVLVAMVTEREELTGLKVDRRRTLITAGIGLVVFLVVAFAWYGPNFHATIEYIKSTTGGPLAEGAGPEDPYTFHAITSFTLGVLNFNLTWVILLLGAVALVLDWEAIRGLFTKPVRWPRLWKLAFLLAWAVIPYLSVALAHNQDVRLMAPAFPAVAVLVAGAVSYVKWTRVRYAIAGLAVFVLAYQTLNHITHATPGFLPDQATVTVGEYSGVVQLNTQPIGYEELPGDDYATPVVKYIEELAAKEPGGLTVPRTVCMLESEATMNSNTLGWIIAARKDPFGLADVVVNEAGKKGEEELEKILSGCNYAIYVKQPLERNAESRLTIVNNPYAANHMTPKLFSLFKGPTKTFPLAANVGSEHEVSFLTAEGGVIARVLTRTPGQGLIE